MYVLCETASIIHHMHATHARNIYKKFPRFIKKQGNNYSPCSKVYACSSFVLKWNITIPNGGSVSGSEYG